MPENGRQIPVFGVWGTGMTELPDDLIELQRLARPLIHLDRGVQYACKDFRQILWSRKLRQSMSRKGDCWDNAVSESFFSILKFELDLNPSMPTQEVRQAVFEYIEVFYNRKRLHSTIGFKSPEEVEKQYWLNKTAS